MGRRKTGNRPIAQIKIIIDDHVEVFDLELETLCGRKRAVQRAKALHDEAVAHIKRPADAPKGDPVDSIFQARPPVPPVITEPAIRENVDFDPDNPYHTVGFELWEPEFRQDLSNVAKDDIFALSWPFIQ
jgi:hypothetical protein